MFLQQMKRATCMPYAMLCVQSLPASSKAIVTDMFSILIKPVIDGMMKDTWQECIA